MQDSYDEFLYGSGGGVSTSASQRQRGAAPPGSAGPPQAALPPLPSAIPSIAPSLSNGTAPLRLPALSTAQPMSSSSHSQSHQPRPRTRGESSPVLAATSPYTRQDRVNPFDPLPASSGSVHSPGLGDRFDSEASIVTRPPHPQRHNSRGSTDPQTSSTTAPSSKSVLTVALQRAQSAVLLDSANNYPSAIAAYSQAVRLLKEVMARVEDGSREMERKLSDAGTAPRVGESEDDWERRRAKYERKEKAKLDEARRLRVIHDTYEDRIRMLVQMGTPLPPPSPSFGSASSFPSTSASSLDTFERATNHDRQPSSPLDPHRPLASHPYAYDSGAAATPRTAAFAALQDGDGQGIGAAMVQLGQASHVAEPVLARLPVVHDGSDLDRLSAFRGQQPRRPLSFASDSTAIAVAGGGAATPTSPHLPSPIPLSPLDPMVSLGAVASSAGERARTSAGGLPDIASNVLDDTTVQPAILERNRDESTVQPTQYGAAPAMRRGQSFGGDVAFRPHTETRPTEMLRGYSTGSIVPVRRGSSISALAFVEEGGAPVDIRPRPTRNASLVNPTTQDGTISQRRNQQGLPEAVVRAPSTETERPIAIDDFGRPRDSAKHESWATTTGSLPARLRSVSTSTGSRRPRLPPFEEMPSPSLGAAPAAGGHRTTLSGSSSASGPPSRKSSVPTPTSLGAPSIIGAASNGPPSLGRSPSASSIGSSASSSYPRRRTRPSFSGHASSQSVSSSGVYLSAGLANHPPPDATSREATLAIHPARRPFHLMRLVLSTMPPSAGGYVSEKLFIPAQIWTTSAGAKLVALETKVRMLDLLATGLDALERAGRGLLLVPTASASARAVARQEADRFARELDGFEGLTEGVQSTLARKSVSSAAIEPKTGRKGSTASFASWSSKLSQSLNRVTNGASLDSQAAYVEAIAKVLKQAQFLDEHFALILPQPSLAADDGPYALLERATRQQLERSLRRTSDFFGQVLCRFVLQDVGVLLDKYVKRGGAWLSAD